MPIRGILFDKDGTLIDSAGTWAPVYRTMLDERFPGEAERKLALAGYDRETGGFQAGSVLAQSTTRELVALWWPDVGESDLDAAARALDAECRGLALSHLKPLMPLAPLLEDLRRRGLVLGIATNDTEATARLHMAALGVADMFAAIIGYDSVARAKPAADMLALFAGLTGLDVSEIAMVGDNPHDIETARNGGAGLAIAVLSGNAGHADIAHLADHTLASVAELPALLERL